VNKNTHRIKVIEINGRSYDANSGQPIGGAPIAVITPDVVAPVKPAAKPVAKTVHKTVKSKARKPAPVAKHHKTQASKTLMRHAVQRPSAKPGRHANSALVPHAAAVVAKPSVAQVDIRRLARAHAVDKSKHISRFGVAAASASEGGTRPLIPEPVVVATPDEQLPARRESEILFEHAMANATGHLQPRHNAAKKRRVSRRARNWSAATLAVVLLGGFMAYQNLASIQLHMATSRIGFAASVPGYRPAGFSLGHFSYSPGLVAFDYHSNSDDRSFALREQPTSWDSQTLYAQALNNSYHALQIDGTTVYVDDQNNAAWVAHGIWYQLTNHQALGSRSLSDLVKST
jgi:hypothetical protein